MDSVLGQNGVLKGRRTISMSALGQKRTCPAHKLMSALGQSQTFRDSLDQLVGALLEVKRYVQSERPGRLQVDDKLEFRRLHDREVRGLSALEG